MDEQSIAVARKCLEGAYENTLSFPGSVRLLMEAGFEGYAVDYRRHTRIYYRPDGASIVLESPASDGAVAARFDKDGVEACIRWAQSGAGDYSYEAFNRKVIGFGCAGYLVSFSGARVVYYGRTGELHVEHFPQ